MDFRRYFKTRIQFSFNVEKEDGTNHLSKLNIKVAELFYKHYKTGNLKSWLMQLAYAAAENELKIEDRERRDQGSYAAVAGPNKSNDS